MENNMLTAMFENSGEPLSTDLLNWINSNEETKTLETRPFHKTGLGLVIVKRILALHSSHLTASATKNATNSFTFTLPVYNP